MPRVTASHHGPASATLAGEWLSRSRATASSACSIDAAGHPLVTTASLITTARHRAVHRAVGLPRARRAATHRSARASRSAMPHAARRASSASSTAFAVEDRPRREGAGGGGLSVRVSGLGRTSAATLAVDMRPRVAAEMRPPMGGSGVAAITRLPPETVAGCAGAVVRTWYRFDRNCSPPVSYTHLRAHETDSYLVCRLLLEKKKQEGPPLSAAHEED